MSLFKSFTMTIERRTGYYDTADGGRWKYNPSSNLTIKGSFQPINGKEMQSLPEGRRSNGVYQGSTDTKIYTTKQDRGDVLDDPSDVLIKDNKRYEIVEAGDWQNNIINHYWFRCVREKE